MWPDTLKSLSVSLSAIFIVTFMLMGLDVMSAFVVVVTITVIIVNLGGLMYYWSISLNAVSLVNLVMVSNFLGLMYSYFVSGFTDCFVFFAGCGHFR